MGSVKVIGEVDLKLIAPVSMTRSEIDNLIPNCVSLHNLWRFDRDIVIMVVYQR